MASPTSSHNLIAEKSSAMNETWDLIRNITEVIGMFAIPIFSWVVYTLIQQGKQIIVLEQRVNESMMTRLGSVEAKVQNLEDKIDSVNKNINETKILINDNKNLGQQVNEKFSDLFDRIDRL